MKYLILILLAPIFANASILPNYIPNTCILDANDPFEPNQRMTQGPLKGYCVSPIQRRSADILPNEIASQYFQIRHGDVVIANFSHRGRFWVARIPVGSATRVLLQTQFFPIASLPVVGPIHIAHVQFRFQFKQGEKILLKPQTFQTDINSPSEEIEDMIFSVENIGPFGEKFDAKKGFAGHYNIAYRAISLADKYKWMVIDQGHQVTQHEISFSPEQTQQLLGRALGEAEKYGTRRSYHTINPNCSTELFVLIDRITGDWLWSRPFLPNSAVNALRTRGILSERSLPDFNEEHIK